MWLCRQVISLLQKNYPWQETKRKYTKKRKEGMLFKIFYAGSSDRFTCICHLFHFPLGIFFKQKRVTFGILLPAVMATRPLGGHYQAVSFQKWARRPAPSMPSFMWLLGSIGVCVGSDPTQVTFVPSTCGLGATQRTTGEDHANLR